MFKDYKNMEEMNFEEMRKQFAILKNELKHQEIVNDRLLRTTMKSKTHEMSSTKRFEFICVAICLVIYPMSYFTEVWSLAFATGTCIMVLFCAAATWYIHKPVEELNFMRDDFSTVARVMAKFKKQYNDWLHYVAPALLIPWISWACYEIVWKNAPENADAKMLFFMSLPLIFGACLGAIVGYRFHRKAVNAAQDILDEIEE